MTCSSRDGWPRTRIAANAVLYERIEPSEASTIEGVCESVWTKPISEVNDIAPAEQARIALPDVVNHMDTRYCEAVFSRRQLDWYSCSRPSAARSRPSTEMPAPKTQGEIR